MQRVTKVILALQELPVQKVTKVTKVILALPALPVQRVIKVILALPVIRETRDQREQMDWHAGI